MNKLKQTKFFSLLFLVALMLFSCNEQDENFVIKQNSIQEINLVSKDAAELIANNLLFDNTLSSAKTAYSKTTVKKFNKKR